MMRDGLADAPSRQAAEVVARDIAEILAESLRVDGGVRNGRSLPVLQ
jgi:hypothetical protein